MGLKDMLNNLKKSNIQKVQFTLAINFVSSKDNDKERVMLSMSDIIEIMIKVKADEATEELFESFCSRYQIGLEASMKSSDFIFHHIDLLYYKYHKVNLMRGASYIDSPDWIKNKATINSNNKYDGNCFKQHVTLALNHVEIEKSLERITKIKSFIDKHNLKGMNYQSE